MSKIPNRRLSLPSYPIPISSNIVKLLLGSTSENKPDFGQYGLLKATKKTTNNKRLVYYLSFFLTITIPFTHCTTIVLLRFLKSSNVFINWPDTFADFPLPSLLELPDDH